MFSFQHGPEPLGIIKGVYLTKVWTAFAHLQPSSCRFCPPFTCLGRGQRLSIGPKMGPFRPQRGVSLKVIVDLLGWQTGPAGTILGLFLTHHLTVSFHSGDLASSGLGAAHMPRLQSVVWIGGMLDPFVHIMNKQRAATTSGTHDRSRFQAWSPAQTGLHVCETCNVGLRRMQCRPGQAITPLQFHTNQPPPEQRVH